MVVVGVAWVVVVVVVVVFLPTRLLMRLATPLGFLVVLLVVVVGGLLVVVTPLAAWAKVNLPPLVPGLLPLAAGSIVRFVLGSTKRLAEI